MNIVSLKLIVGLADFGAGYGFERRILCMEGESRSRAQLFSASDSVSIFF